MASPVDAHQPDRSAYDALLGLSSSAESSNPEINIQWDYEDWNFRAQNAALSYTPSYASANSPASHSSVLSGESELEHALVSASKPFLSQEEEEREYDPRAFDSGLQDNSAANAHSIPLIEDQFGFPISAGGDQALFSPSSPSSPEVMVTAPSNAQIPSHHVPQGDYMYRDPASPSSSAGGDLYDPSASTFSMQQQHSHSYASSPALTGGNLPNAAFPGLDEQTLDALNLNHTASAESSPGFNDPGPVTGSNHSPTPLIITTSSGPDEHSTNLASHTDPSNNIANYNGYAGSLDPFGQTSISDHDPFGVNSSAADAPSIELFPSSPIDRAPGGPPGPLGNVPHPSSGGVDYSYIENAHGALPNVYGQTAQHSQMASSSSGSSFNDDMNASIKDQIGIGSVGNLQQIRAMLEQGDSSPSNTGLAAPDHAVPRPSPSPGPNFGHRARSASHSGLTSMIGGTNMYGSSLSEPGFTGGFIMRGVQPAGSSYPTQQAATNAYNNLVPPQSNWHPQRPPIDPYGPLASFAGGPSSGTNPAPAQGGVDPSAILDPGSLNAFNAQTDQQSGAGPSNYGYIDANNSSLHPTLHQSSYSAPNVHFAGGNPSTQRGYDPTSGVSSSSFSFRNELTVPQPPNWGTAGAGGVPGGAQLRRYHTTGSRHVRNAHSDDLRSIYGSGRGREPVSSTDMLDLTRGPGGTLAPPRPRGSSASGGAHSEEALASLVPGLQLGNMNMAMDQQVDSSVGPERRRRGSSASSHAPYPRSSAASVASGSAHSSPGQQPGELSNAPEGSVAQESVARQWVTTPATTVASQGRRKNKGAFVCPVAGCGSTFTRSFNLKGHMRSHRDERPYKCKWEGCTKSFARSHDCKRHENLHLENRPYVCEGCQKQFARLDALNRHHKSEGGIECARQLGLKYDPDPDPGEASGNGFLV